MERQEMTAPTVDPIKLYLRPGTQECGKLKVLRIVDFIMKIVAKEEDKLLIDNGGNKLFLKSGPTKPKLESVTMNQWVIGALRILNHFLESNQISSLTEMQSYVGYMVKVMELAGCYDWVSVLRYDDDFCHMQALYNIPWLYESHHIHLTRLQPKQAATGTAAEDKLQLGVSPAVECQQAKFPALLNTLWMAAPFAAILIGRGVVSLPFATSLMFVT